MIDVLLLTVNDWANTGWRTAKCLRSLGLEVVGIKKNPHVFMYPDQLTVYSHLPYEATIGVQNWSSLASLVKEARVVHMMHSNLFDFGDGVRLNNLVLQHGGAAYRRNHKVLNEAVKDIPHNTVIQMPDLMGLGAINEHLIYFSVDTDYIQPVYKRMNTDKLIIGHFPTWDCKGTDKIIEVLKKLKRDPETKDAFEYIGEPNTEIHYPWSVQLKRLEACDIVIDGMQPTLTYGEDRTFKYGEWGNTTFEASAMGKIVITHTHSEDMYVKEYGCEPQVAIANEPDQLEENLRILFRLKDRELLKMKMSARIWVEQNHSIKATASRYWNKIYGEIL
jgi:glycosyltransferase involved in cell wall biosynthesis